MKELLFFSLQRRYIFALLLLSSTPLLFIGELTLGAFIDSNFFAFFLTSSYILLVYFKLKDISKMYNLLLTRLGEKRFYLGLVVSSGLTITIYAGYTLLLMSGAYLTVGGEKTQYFSIYAVLFCMNLILFWIIDLVSIFSIKSKNKAVANVCLFLFNLCYHYLFIQATIYPFLLKHL